MNQKYRHSLVLLFALILGPFLFSGTGGLASSIEWQEGLYQTIDKFSVYDAVSSEHVMNQDNEDCDRGLVHYHSSAQCTTCALEQLSMEFHSADLTAVPQMLQVDGGAIKQFPTYLFRPPKT
jgi:hypothetical protein